MSNFGITARQQDAFTVIERYIAEHGISPAFEDIASALGLRSKGGVSQLLNGLSRRGYIDWLPRQARSIKITKHTTPLILSSEVEEKLKRYCAAHDEIASAVLADAVILHLDLMEAEHSKLRAVE